MNNDIKQFRQSLQTIGLSSAIINAAWPDWWSDEAEESPSARNELRFSLARKLGLDPVSLSEKDEPKFVWRGESKFKGLSTEDDQQLAAIESFGVAIGQKLISATQEKSISSNLKNAKRIRDAILINQEFITLNDLIALCWSFGIPVIHLRVFPLSAKHMCAMTVRANNRYAILLGKDSNYPATVAYYLAHEIGHIARGHLDDKNSIVDLQDPFGDMESWDEEEKEADQFALELLTGKPNPKVTSKAKSYTAYSLAGSLLTTAKKMRIEPGTLALCFGHSTKDWPRAMAAMRHIYKKEMPVWREVNGIARKQIDWDALSDDNASYIKAIMGGANLD